MPLLPETDPEQRKQIMLDYLLLMVELEDWHGVRDAAADLELMEAKDAATRRPD